MPIYLQPKDILDELGQFDSILIVSPVSAPVSFTAAVFNGAGLDQDKVSQFKQMLAAEHL